MLRRMSDSGDKSIYQRLEAQLKALDSQSRRRTLTPTDRSAKCIAREGHALLNLAGNDYLALAQHPHVKAAAKRAIDQAGTGAGASRLITGSLDHHAALEQRFASFKHAEAALLLPTGYQANLAALTALAGAGDLICLDKLNHASLIDAAHMTGATVRTFPHHNHAKLQRLLERHADGQGPDATGQKPKAKSQEPTANGPAAQAFIVSDTIFSMDGDAADLPGLCALAERYDATLIVDEAHATGIFGQHGAGLAEAQGVAGRIDVTISTASKALGGLGGIVTARQVVIDALINHARSAIYTTAVPPAQAAAIDAALDIVESEPERRTRLHQLSQHVRGELTRLGWSADADEPAGHSNQPSDISNQQSAISNPLSPIIPIIVGDTERALALSQHLREAGVLAAAIRYPTVAPGAERVRLSLRCDLTDAELQHVIEALSRFDLPTP